MKRQFMIVGAGMGMPEGPNRQKRHCVQQIVCLPQNGLQRDCPACAIVLRSVCLKWQNARLPAAHKRLHLSCLAIPDFSA